MSRELAEHQHGFGGRKERAEAFGQRGGIVAFPKGQQAAVFLRRGQGVQRGRHHVAAGRGQLAGGYQPFRKGQVVRMAALGFLFRHARLHVFQFFLQRRVFSGGIGFIVHRVLVRGVLCGIVGLRDVAVFTEGQEQRVVLGKGKRSQALHRRRHGPQYAHMPQVIAAWLRIVRGIRRVERRRNVLVAPGFHGFRKGRIHLPEIRFQPQAHAFQSGHPAHCRVVRLWVPDNQRRLVQRSVVSRGYGGKVRLAELDRLPRYGPVSPGSKNGFAHEKTPPLSSVLQECKGGVFERALEKAFRRIRAGMDGGACRGGPALPLVYVQKRF